MIALLVILALATPQLTLESRCGAIVTCGSAFLWPGGSSPWGTPTVPTTRTGDCCRAPELGHPWPGNTATVCLSYRCQGQLGAWTDCVAFTGRAVVAVCYPLPPPPSSAIFADGFETGDLSRWSGGVP